MLKTLRQCATMLSPALRRRWLLLVPLAVVTSATEVGAASALFVLLGLLANPTGLQDHAWGALVIGWLPWEDDGHRILALALLLALLYVGKSLLLVGAQYIRLRITAESRAFLASQMLWRYLTAPYPFHLRRNSAELIRNCTTSVGEVLDGVVGVAIGTLADLLMSLGLVATMVTVNGPRTTAIVALLAVLMAGALKATRRAAARLSGGTHELSATTLRGLQQAFGGIKELKVLGREQYFYDEFVERQRQALELGYLGIAVSSLPSVLVQSVLVLAGIALIVFLSLTGMAGPDTIPVAGLFGYAGLRVMPMMNAVVAGMNAIRSQRRAADELYDDYLSLAPPATTAAVEPLTFKQAITLDRVSYVYPDAVAPALTDCSLVIRRGESIGVVGATGAGKSTLVDLILGLLQPTSGRVRVDGTDLATDGVRWTRRVGYVPQQAFLIDDTLRRNVALGIPDAAIDEGRLRSALGLAQLTARTERFPEGLETPLGERGVRLSGGERQRVAIARALYHDPDVLVFDEATASLDLATEAEVNHAIGRLRGAKTMVVIAHRLSTVSHCDRIVWLRDGRVAAVGGFEELQQEHAGFREFTGARTGQTGTPSLERFVERERTIAEGPLTSPS